MYDIAYKPNVVHKDGGRKKEQQLKISTMRELMLILHFIGLTMGLGTSFAHAFLGIATSKMSTDEATKFRLHSLVLGRMGNIGIGLLIISGLYLITPYWAILPSSPLLILKLTLGSYLLY